jgi:hypothetical protein
MPGKELTKEFNLGDDSIEVDDQGRVVINHPELADFLRASKDEEAANKPAAGVYFSCKF